MGRAVHADPLLRLPFGLRLGLFYRVTPMLAVMPWLEAREVKYLPTRCEQTEVRDRLPLCRQTLQIAHLVISAGDLIVSAKSCLIPRSISLIFSLAGFALLQRLSKRYCCMSTNDLVLHLHT